MPKFVEVILPLAFSGQTFTYLCDEQVEIGMRVVVPFKNVSAIGVVVGKHDYAPNYKVKSVLALVDLKPVITGEQVELMRWIADYYMCPIGEVYRQIVPKGIKNANYREPTRVGYLLKNKNIEQVELLIKKRKAAQNALKILLSFGEGACVTQKIILNSGATMGGIKGLLEFDIVEKVEIEVNVYSEPKKNETEEKGEEFVGKTNDKPTLYVGRRVEECLEIVKQAVQRANKKGGICLVLAANNFDAKKIATLLNDDAVIEFHAYCSDKIRSENYFRILNFANSVKCVVGTKLALLLPYVNLEEIVILDEASHRYKNDRSPRINGRDCAIMLAGLHKATVSMTAIVPSLETYANCKYGRMNLVDLRVEDKPNVKILEKGKGQLFSKYMIARINDVISEAGQVIVFQNRRGFAGSIVCKECGYTPLCPFCNVTLTMHQTNLRLMCHHCDYSKPIFNRCLKCHSTELEAQGMGTERVEQQLMEIFPMATISRIDSDTVARSDAFGEIRDDLKSANSDIIVATQLILSGLKIPNAKIAIVVNADNMFLSTDFRTSEKIIATLTQLRYLVSEELIIQTTNSQNPLLKAVLEDYFLFMDSEMIERARHNYPPVSRLITIRLYHDDNKILQKAAIELDQVLLPIFESKLMSPYEPLGERRIKGNFVLELMLKLKRDNELINHKKRLNDVLKVFAKRHSGVNFTIDVDPL